MKKGGRRKEREGESENYPLTAFVFLPRFGLLAEFFAAALSRLFVYCRVMHQLHSKKCSFYLNYFLCIRPQSEFVCMKYWHPN